MVKLTTTYDDYFRFWRIETAFLRFRAAILQEGIRALEASGELVVG